MPVIISTGTRLLDDRWHLAIILHWFPTTMKTGASATIAENYWNLIRITGEVVILVMGHLPAISGIS